MKIAVSSASFARVFGSGELTQLEWLDVCANELEADAVVFDAAHFPRTDDEYLAQLKKSSVDLGLAVAGVAANALFEGGGESWLTVAERLGAPLALVTAPFAGEDPNGWGAFVDAVKERTRAAKRVNVTLALRNVPGTLCATAAELRRLAKDVDSAWLRFAFDPLASGTSETSEATETLLAKSVIAVAVASDIARFATDDDRDAPALIRALARFRGCVVLEDGSHVAARDAYHRALARFADVRARTLTHAG